ncbi:FadR/GntR family transcriptional regulator [Novosphingobium guangzhouense]|uniref:GntR family transcriptional regulator n=1 Tax=Novosphingobium guangzhouense TaxID=1850347 RepID=A0A2K2G004_9SPHN|nr:FadR/GntR family transcriptional regulator [Novosphingobium guangzhouense]PNU04361.1 GntR family transcriptional regulator [Novosphingobium guangzhouense]
MPQSEAAHPKLYGRVARQIEEHISGSAYPAGARLPGERTLAALIGVSRPTIREAMLVLEMQDLVEVRRGSGVYVAERVAPARLARKADVSAFELIEARLMFEGQAAGLAARVMSDGMLDSLEAILARIEGRAAADAEEPALDRQFHLAIARGTGNALIARTIEHLWDLHEGSVQSCQAFRDVRRDPRPAEYRRVYEALRNRDGMLAQSAMRMHLVRLSDDFLAFAEMELIASARRQISEKRRRLAPA